MECFLSAPVWDRLWQHIVRTVIPTVLASHRWKLHPLQKWGRVCMPRLVFAVCPCFGFVVLLFVFFCMGGLFCFLWFGHMTSQSVCPGLLLDIVTQNWGGPQNFQVTWPPIQKIHWLKIRKGKKKHVFCFINSSNACTIARTVRVARPRGTKIEESVNHFETHKWRGRQTIAGKVCTRWFDAWKILGINYRPSQLHFLIKKKLKTLNWWSTFRRLELIQTCFDQKRMCFSMTVGSKRIEMCQVYIKWVENAIATHIKQRQAAGLRNTVKKKNKMSISVTWKSGGRMRCNQDSLKKVQPKWDNHALCSIQFLSSRSVFHLAPLTLRGNNPKSLHALTHGKKKTCFTVKKNIQTFCWDSLNLVFHHEKEHSH